jgi:uncharacterized protein DUF4203
VVLPQAYELPAAILLVIASAVTCFAGYPLFRIVLAIWGFILGASIGSSMMGVGNPFAMVIAGVVGGVLGALALVFAYFMGVALLGAGLGALVGHVAWSQFATGDPPAALIVGLAIVGAVGAMVLQRYVIIVGTAFAGAWMLLVGVLTIADRGSVRAVRGAANDVWILYPLSATGRGWTIVAWIVVGVVGMAVQLVVTGRKR